MLKTMKSKLAYVTKKFRLSPIWIVPILTLFIGVWIILLHFVNQGQTFTLIASSAEGIIANKTVIKNRSVTVGIVENVILSDDFSSVKITARIDRKMEPLLKNDSVFWVVKPEISREGVSGLNTLFSGIYIQLHSGDDNEPLGIKEYKLLDSEPITLSTEPGIRVLLTSEYAESISVGAPVFFKGFRVGRVETSEFDTAERLMKYQVFVSHPYNSLVTKNVRFWRDNGINFDLSAQGATLSMPSLDVLLSGGINFDVPSGAPFGVAADDKDTYRLYDSKSDIQDSQYTNYTEFLLFFPDSIDGLVAGAPLKYRGIRLGSVSKVPYYLPEMLDDHGLNYNIPVLVRVEPERLASSTDMASFDVIKALQLEQQNGLRAAIKSASLLTGQMYIDLDIYPDRKDEILNVEKKQFGYLTIATVPSSLSQIQSNVIKILDKINNLPLDKTVENLNDILVNGQKLAESLNKIVDSKEIQNLPKDIQNSVQGLNETLKGLQPGSDLYNKLTTDLDKFDMVLDELQPLLNTLNEKSNALIFSAPAKQDPQPKAKGN